MPTHAHTPASSRRFLPPSTISRDPLHTPAPSRRLPNFALSTQSSSSTRLSQASRFKKPSASVEEDIETSFEVPSSSPPLPSRSKFTPSGLRAYDPIDDLDEDVPTLQRSSSLRTDLSIAQGDDLSDLIYLEKTRGGKIHKPATDPVREFPEEDFLPHKTRRLSAVKVDATDPVVISSSSYGNRSYIIDRGDEDYDPETSEHQPKPTFKQDAETDNDDDMSLSPVVPRSLARFRMPGAPARPSHLPHARSIFKPPQFQRSSHLDPSPDSALPDAFSPSRRRGRRDYIPSGAAETVRSWILSIAAGQSQPDAKYTESFKVARITKDRDGRCAVVESEERTTWLLIEQQSRSRARASKQPCLGQIAVGNTATVKGANTVWTIEPADLPQIHSPNVSPSEEGLGKYSVSVLWDLTD